MPIFKWYNIQHIVLVEFIKHSLGVSSTYRIKMRCYSSIPFHSSCCKHPLRQLDGVPHTSSSPHFLFSSFLSPNHFLNQSINFWIFRTFYLYSLKSHPNYPNLNTYLPSCLVEVPPIACSHHSPPKSATSSRAMAAGPLLCSRWAWSPGKVVMPRKDWPLPRRSQQPTIPARQAMPVTPRARNRRPTTPTVTTTRLRTSTARTLCESWLFYRPVCWEPFFLYWFFMFLFSFSFRSRCGVDTPSQETNSTPCFLIERYPHLEDQVSPF